MAADIPVYSARKVKVTFAGYTMDGLAPDSFIEFSLNSDLTDEEVGADGSVAISISPDETGTFTLSLQQNSPADTFLSAILNAQRTEGKLVVSPLTIDDPSGLNAVIGGAHIKTAPTVTRGSSATGNTNDYVFFAKKLHFQSTTPSSSSAGSLVANALAAADLVDQYFI